ncbi:SpoIIE family protein phosphatase [Methanobrevibacter sp. DSM 116169]|uniref:SpoIIE family protein phosphatase n=1 Tax=Methanobrevibacter sp. DSM 116169 TaxID=3242727 RepID=UPI0038FC5F95
MENNLKNSDLKNKAKIMIICIITYVIVNLTFKYFFQIVPITELRPSAALTPSFGLLFGPIGALSAAIGNLIGDIYSGYSIEVCVIGFLAQFLYGYIPYKMWYSIKVKDEITHPRLNTVYNLIKYFIIVFVNSAIMTCLLGFLLDSVKVSQFISFESLLIEFNNLNFTLTLGALIIIIANIMRFKLYIPNENYGKSSKIFNLSLISGLLIGLGYLIYSIVYINDFDSEIYIIGTIFYILIIFYTLKPINNKIKVNKSKLKVSLSEKLIIIFITIGVVVAFLTGMILLSENYSEYGSIMFWEKIYISIGFIISISYLIAIIFLYKIEKDIAKPIEAISDLTASYVNEIDENTDYVLDDIEKYSSYDDEIGTLSKSLIFLMKKLENYKDDVEKETADKERLKTEIKIGRKIQKTLLPKTFPDTDKFEIIGLNSSSDDFKGDFYDYIIINDEKLAILIAEPLDYGIGSTLFMMRVKTLIKNSIKIGNSLSDSFFKLNNKIYENNNEKMQLKLFLGILDLKSNEFSYINAGFNDPIILKDGGFEVLKSFKNEVLGLNKDVEYKFDLFELENNDLICSYNNSKLKKDILKVFNQCNVNDFEMCFNQILNENPNFKMMILEKK